MIAEVMCLTIANIPAVLFGAALQARGGLSRNPALRLAH
jgi:hypothetical protein